MNKVEKMKLALKEAMLSRNPRVSKITVFKKVAADFNVSPKTTSRLYYQDVHKDIADKISNVRADAWTQEEDAIIIECVANNPININEALKTAANSLIDRKRSLKAVVIHWYNVLAPSLEEHRDHKNKCFMIISNDQISINRKCISKQNPEDIDANIDLIKMVEILIDHPKKAYIINIINKML